MKRSCMLFMALLVSMPIKAATDVDKKQELDSVIEKLRLGAKRERIGEGSVLMGMAVTGGIIANNSYNDTNHSANQWGGLVVGLGSLAWGIEKFIHKSNVEDEAQIYASLQEGSAIHLATKVRRGEELLETLAEQGRNRRYEFAAASGLASAFLFHATQFKKDHQQKNDDVRLGSYLFLAIGLKYLIWKSPAERAYHNYQQRIAEMDGPKVSFDIAPIPKGSAAYITLTY